MLKFGLLDIDLNSCNPFEQALDVGRKQVRSKEGNTKTDQKFQVVE